MGVAADDHHDRHLFFFHDAAVRLLVSGARVVKHHITYHIRVRPSRENMIKSSPSR